MTKIKHIKTKQLLLFLAIFVASVISIPSISYAHELRTSGSIHVLLHVSPNDEPVTNHPSQLNFHILDDEGKFKGANCDCAVKVTLNETVLLNSPVNVGAFDYLGFNQAGIVPFVFPSVGNYQVNFSGKPIAGYDFHAFSLNYTKNVSLVGHSVNHDEPFFIGSAILGVVIVAITLFAIKEFKDE